MGKIKALEAEEMLIEKELRIKEMENELERRIQKDSALIIDAQPAANVASINDLNQINDSDKDVIVPITTATKLNKIASDLPVSQLQEDSDDSSEFPMEEIKITKEDLATSSEDDVKDIESVGNESVDNLNPEFSHKEYTEQVEYHRATLDKERLLMQKRNEVVKKQLEE